MFHDFLWGSGPFPWIIIGLIIWLIADSNKKKESPSQYQRSEPDMFNRESALDILKKRYAKGEITKEQYEQMKKDIE
ncbi:MAG: SHOCT domain-containing protein [Ignavibacteriaceae bacterium]